MQIKLTELENLVYALREARDHLNYCGYGDSWERECAMDTSNGPNLPTQIEEALKPFETMN